MNLKKNCVYGAMFIFQNFNKACDICSDETNSMIPHFQNRSSCLCCSRQQIMDVGYHKFNLRLNTKFHHLSVACKWSLIVENCFENH